jgi:TolB protein
MKWRLACGLLVLVYFPCFSQNSPIGIFDNQKDVGYVKIAGSSVYDAATQSYTIKGSGANIWFNEDQFHFTYKKISGDFILTGDFAFTGDTVGAIGHRKIGWMVRESAEADAVSFNGCKHIDGLIAVQWREMRGAFMQDPEGEIFSAKRGLLTMQVERKGKILTMRMAHPGEPLQDVGSHELRDLKDSVVVGIYICSHDSNTLASARVWNVRIDRPVENPYYPNPLLVKPPPKEVMGSRLEIVDVADGNREVIYESKGRFEAPNWMPDGKKLLFNDHGSLFTIPIEGGQPEKLNTGSAAKINNDHGISFDGKTLAISNSRDGMPGGGSSVYILPLTGGEPKLLTDQTPSYWHGWNPNNKELCYVAQRGTKIYNIYKLDINGGKEVQLTFNTTGHVDGPEYSPDGKYIYYNANASGTMQIWRMKPDGSGKEQITFDEYHNWFPHISPDGKWIVFISFPIDIDPNSHPNYQKVMLRLMPAAGGAPRVLAYLFGGQGTLNAPSWSPDSKRLAFVSNSDK